MIFRRYSPSGTCLDRRRDRISVSTPVISTLRLATTALLAVVVDQVQHLPEVGGIYILAEHAVTVLADVPRRISQHEPAAHFAACLVGLLALDYHLPLDES